MPGTTVPFGLPYPTAGDTTSVPKDVQALAEATDALMLTTLANAAAAGMPGSVVVRGGPQPTLNATITSLVFDTEVFDNAGYADLQANNSLITLVNGALYIVQAFVAFAPNATGYREFFIIDGNGAILTDWRSPAVTDPGTGVTTVASGMFQPNAFSSVRLSAVQTSGTTLQVLSCGLAAFRIG